MRVPFYGNGTGRVVTQRESDLKMLVVCIKIQPPDCAAW